MPHWGTSSEAHRIYFIAAIVTMTTAEHDDLII